MGVRPSLPSTGVCFHRCRVWKQLWLCRGWVPASVNRSAMLNIQPLGAKRLRRAAVPPCTHLLGRWHWPFITQINSTFAATPPLFTLRPAPNICTHKPSLTSLSTYDLRLQAFRLFSSSLFSLQYRSFTPPYPALSTDLISFFPSFFFFTADPAIDEEFLNPGQSSVMHWLT